MDTKSTLMALLLLLFCPGNGLIVKVINVDRFLHTVQFILQTGNRDRALTL
jgi:hypothetical protein